MKREKLSEIIRLIEAQALRARERVTAMTHCDGNAQTSACLNKELGAANAYENVLEALKHGDTIFLQQ